MQLTDYKERKVRFSKERRRHIAAAHPEMKDQLPKIQETLKIPDVVNKSKLDNSVELFYKFYEKTPVTSKYLCILVKITESDNFIITSYFTDTIKKGMKIWKKK